MSCFFFFNDTATTEIYTLSLHDALPIYTYDAAGNRKSKTNYLDNSVSSFAYDPIYQLTQVTQASTTVESKTRHRIVQIIRSEEHTSELQSHLNLVCRLLLEKKKHTNTKT